MDEYDRREEVDKQETEKIINDSITEVNAERKAEAVDSLHIGPFRNPSQHEWPKEIAELMASYISIPAYSEKIVKE